MEQEKHTDIIKYFLKNDLLLSKDFLDSLGSDFSKEEFNSNLNKRKGASDISIITLDVTRMIDKGTSLEINWHDFEKSRVLFEKGANKDTYLNFIQFLKTEEVSSAEKARVKVMFSYKEESTKRDVQDFVSYFNARYKEIENILRNRPELQNLTTISRLRNKTDKEAIAIIGMVKEKQTTPKGGLMITVEDPTGWIKVYVNNNRAELFSPAKDISVDEVIGILGTSGDKILFANKIIWPDVPLNKELKRSPDECHAAFLSDIHIGSTNFLGDEFSQFIEWTKGNLGSKEHKDIAKKLRYIFIAGDIVDGLGVYPGQEEELTIKDMKEQYDESARLLKQIPSHINIILCPGNHDAMRIAEPQPEFYRDFAEALWQLPNVTIVSNPAAVNIHSSTDFPGFDVLMYHGYSFDYYVANVDSIRNGGGYDRADLIMQFLLQRRHLAPAHSSTLYIPDVKQDPLVIGKLPDIFVTGHIHKSAVHNYRNITLVCGSCWQSKTPFQEKVGHNPEPARVPVLNLQTRKYKLLRFGK